MTDVTYKEANRRYRRMFLPVMAVYVVACFAGPLALNVMGDPPDWVMAGIAVFTALPIAAVFWLKGRWLLETDEYTRARQVEAMLVGGGVTVCFAIIWGFLELFELVPNLWTFLIGPIYFASYGLAFLVGKLRGGRVVS